MIDRNGLPPPSPKVAFVMSGGAALGASQVGMLRALLERDIKPDLIVGTSIGAWNGMWLSFHCDLGEIDNLERIWQGITLAEVFGLNPMNLVINITSKRPFLVTDEGMERVYRRAATLGHFADHPITFEAMPIPFKVTATNIMRGTPRVFDRGPVKPALFASSAIPGLFPPVMIDGEQYVDGGLLDNGGVSVAVAAGATTIYVLSVTYGGFRATPVTSMSELLERSFHLVASRHVHEAIRQSADRATFIVIEDEDAAQMSSLDFRHPANLIASGYRAASAVLDAEEAQHARNAVASRAAKQQLPQFPTVPTKTRLAAWFRQPAVSATLHAVAWVDVALQRGLQRFTPPAITASQRTAPGNAAVNLTPS